MKLLAMVTDGKSIRRFLASTDEATRRGDALGQPLYESS